MVTVKPLVSLVPLNRVLLCERGSIRRGGVEVKRANGLRVEGTGFSEMGGRQSRRQRLKPGDKSHDDDSDWKGEENQCVCVCVGEQSWSFE